MKKIILSAISCTIISAQLWAQTLTQAVPTGVPLQDALVIDALIMKAPNEVADKEAVLRIMRSYTTKEISSVEDLGKVFGNDNPYLDEAFSDSVISELNNKSLRESPVQPIGMPNAGTSGVSGLPSPTMAIDALGSFIAERFKDELNVAFLDKFRDSLRADSALRAVFPKTSTLLLTVDPYSYTTFLKSLAEDFDADLQALPGNLPQLLSMKVPAAKRTDAFYMLLIYLEAIASLQNGATPPQVIDGLSTNAYLDNMGNKDLASALRLSGLLSRSLGSGSTTRFWAPVSQVQLLTLRGNKRLRLLFLGLVMEKERSLFTEKISFGGRTLHTIVSSGSNAGETFSAYVHAAAQELDQMQQLLNSAKSKLDKATIDDFVAYASSLFRFTGTISAVKGWTGSELKEIDAVRKIYLPAAEDALELVGAVEEKQYGEALTIALDLVKPFTDSAWREKLTKYGTFMVSMVSARSSEEMVDALESAALPVGSYRIKRNSAFNVSLNSYAGLAIGMERLLDQDSITRANRDAMHFGFTAPVGLAFSWGCPPAERKKKGKEGMSFTLFFPLIDVGAVTSFRMQDSTAQLPTLAWENVWAPGVYAVVGLRSCLSLYAGTQYGPNLRKIEADGTPIISPAWKMLNAGVTVDIPIFNFYTRVEKKKK